MDYTIFYKTKYQDTSTFAKENTYDKFFSGYNDSDRVKNIFEAVKSNEKYWLIFEHYDLRDAEIPKNGIIFRSTANEESQYVLELLEFIEIEPSQKICFDITGILTPHLLVLLRCLKERNFKKIDFLYAEPSTYKQRERTIFSKDFNKVRQIHGFEGTSYPDFSNDLLVIASGYDDSRITDVANSKPEARKIQIIGFPPLKADMYQENLIRVNRAEDALSGSNFLESKFNIFAPAFDPFVLANELSKFISKEEKNKQITNLYLSPLSTKPHNLGIGIFYLNECKTKHASIIYPFCGNYSHDIAEGISRIWKYEVEFP